MFRNVFYKTKLDGSRGLCIVGKKNEALNDTGMPDRQANEHMCTLWFQGCRQEKKWSKITLLPWPLCTTVFLWCFFAYICVVQVIPLFS